MNPIHHPFGGEAAVLYLAIVDQIAKQGKYLTVADVYAVVNMLAAESEVQLALDIQRRVMQRDIEPDINTCPQCGGEADNGFDRSYPPSPYVCSKCMAKGTPIDFGWQEAPRKIEFGDGMVLGSMAIDKDHSLTVYTEASVADKVKLYAEP